MIVKNKFAPLFAIILLLAATLACQINLGTPTDTPVPPTATPVPQSLEQTIQTALPTTDSGQFSLTLTDAQLTEFVNKELAKEATPILKDAQVHLHKDQIELTGQASQGIFSGEVHILLTATIDDQGQPKIDIQKADFGPMPIPAGILDGMSGMLGDILTSNLGATATGFKLDSILIEEGQMTIQGTLN
jgi:hypothetical protein